MVLVGVRHRVDPDDVPAMSALGLLGVVPRQVGDGLLSALPEGPPLRTPDLATGTDVDGVGRAGDVVVSNPLGGGQAYFVVLGASAGRPGGVLPVPATLADAIRGRTGQGTPDTLSEGLIAQHTLDGGLDTAGWPPARLPRTDAAPTVCWTWHDGRAGVATSDRLPVAGGSVTVELAAGDGPGPRLDAVVLPPGGAGPVRSQGSTGGGTRWLLSSTGALHGLADDRTADALGVTAAGNAPEEALRLLPRADALDLDTVREVRDVGGPG